MTTQRQVGSKADAKPGDVDLTGKEFYLCKRTATGITLCGSTDKVAGVISEGKAAGLWSSFNTGNQLKVVAGAAIAVGDKVVADASAQAIVGTTNIFGEAMTAVTAAGQLVEIDVDRV